MTEIRLVRVGNPDQDVLDFLDLTLPEHLAGNCEISSERLDVAPLYDAARGQFYSTGLLAELVAVGKRHPSAKLLGVTDVDLFIPILTFVFGEAQLGGQSALLSSHRLRQGFYGLPDDVNLLFDRVEKEALHELGHTLGLVHCRDLACVMHFSNSVEEVDLKPSQYCDQCRRRIEQAQDEERFPEKAGRSQLD